MATILEPPPPRLEPGIGSLLARLRRRIRAYLWADGLTALGILAGACFWGSLAMDWLFEPPRPLRLLGLVSFGAAVAYLVSRLLIARLRVPLADRNMALLVERRYAHFHDGLMTAVELADQPDHAVDFNREMLEHTNHVAVAEASRVDLGGIFNLAPLVRRLLLAVGLAASVALFAGLCGEAFDVWLRRVIWQSDELWPRKTSLEVDGLEIGGRMKIARGSDFVLHARADAALGRVIPEIVEVRYSTVEGGRGRENMSREGVVTPGAAEHQPYTHTFKSVLAPLEFYLVGGDDRRGPYYLDVVDSPTISRMTLVCEYPAYMRREPREIPVAGLMQIPRGTQITVEAEANKSLVGVRIDDVVDESAPQTHELDLAAERGGSAMRFRYSIAPLEADRALLFTLKDIDGIRSREAMRLALSVVPDEAPRVEVRLTGIGTAITPRARLPVAGEISDDYGIERVWFEFHADDAPATKQALGKPGDGREKLNVEGALEVAELQLAPKQKFHVAVQAADTFALAGGPNVGASQRYALDVVSPEQLRAMLEARELMLRRRFETIVAEFTDTRNLLAGLAFRPAAKTDGEPAGTEKPAGAAVEPGDELAGELRTASPYVLVERVTQNSQRSGHETLQVAEAFDEIRAEMINNRVDTEELKTRLKDGVADPLRRIVADLFPPLEEELKKLASELADPALATAAQATAIARADAILVEMRQVLDKMLELETFNEVLDMLRQIIDAQDKVNLETKDKQKRKLRDLTE
jgi:hypothetical protein